MKRACVLLVALGVVAAAAVAAREYLVAAGGAASRDGVVRVLMEKEGRYHHIRVTQTGNVRHLQFLRSGTDYEESAVNVEDPLQFELSYYGLMLAGFAHKPDPKGVLFIGLGGGTLPMAIYHYFPQSKVDAVDLDPDVVSVAKEYFGLKEDDRMKVYVGDGRALVGRFIREKKRYDLIFLDAFRGGYIPRHLATKEFMESLTLLLAPDGAVVSNLQPGFASYDCQRRTLAAVFRNQWSYGSFGNVIVVAGDRPDPPAQSTLLATARRLQKEKHFTVDLVAIVRAGGMRNDYQRRGPILTDDEAPADVPQGSPRQ